MGMMAKLGHSAAADVTLTFADGRSTSFSVKSGLARESRTESQADGKSKVTILKDGRGFTIEDGKRTTLPSWITAYPPPDFIPALSRISEFTAAKYNVTLLGDEKIQGRLAHHICITAVPNDSIAPEIEEIISELHVYVDAENWLIVKAETWDFSPTAIENRSKVEIFFDEYRDVSGVLVPHHSTRYVAGQKFSESTLSNVRFDISVSSADFQ
jgi:hypothetical protein